MRAMLGGPALALSWLTVLPVRGPQRIDRAAARRAISWAPLAGLLLGAVAAGVLWLLGRTAAPPLVAGAIAVAVLALGTRGMHVDGLADTVDGLGCYGPPERALAVMRGGGVGAFGAAALIVVALAQATALPTLAERGMWPALVGALVLGRIAVLPACRRGVPAASDTGFGALVAGTQARALIGLWIVTALVAAVWAVPGRWWQGPVVVCVALAAAAALTAHCVRRFGGITGDVLGASVETAGTLALVGLVL